jgi:hypothetical protein
LEFWDSFFDCFSLPARKQPTTNFSDPFAINLDMLWNKIFINNLSVNRNLHFDLSLLQSSFNFSFFVSFAQIAVQFPAHFFKMVAFS